MLSRQATNLFIGRNNEQRRVLIAALMRHHQRIFEEPNTELRHLSRGAAKMFMSGNAHARNYVLRMLGGHLCEQVGACAPRFEHRRPLFFLTIADRSNVRTDKASQWHAESAWPDDDEECLPDINSANPFETMMDRYRRLLPRHGSFIGMMEPAIYVSSIPHVRFAPTFHYHVHALCWDTTKRQLERWRNRINAQSRPLLPYTTAARFDEVKSGDLLQLVWYMTKTPRKQYQIWVRPTGRPKSFKRAINGVNSVRLYADLRDVPLESLLFGGGAGQDVLRAITRKMQRARAVSLADPVRPILRYRPAFDAIEGIEL